MMNSDSVATLTGHEHGPKSNRGGGGGGAFASVVTRAFSANKNDKRNLSLAFP